MPVHDTTTAAFIEGWRRGLALVLAMLCLAPPVTTAGPVTGVVFAGVTATPVASGHRVTIDFNYPVQYVWHFPPSPHQEVLVQVRLLEAEALAGRLPVREESAALDDALKDLFEDIRFDGSDAQTPLVVVRFLHKMHYRIEQGNDWRSLVLYVFEEPRDGDIAPPEAEVMEDDHAASPAVGEERP